jgi:hypothetical protein
LSTRPEHGQKMFVTTFLPKSKMQPLQQNQPNSKTLILQDVEQRPSKKLLKPIQKKTQNKNKTNKNSIKKQETDKSR